MPIRNVAVQKKEPKRRTPAAPRIPRTPRPALVRDVETPADNTRILQPWYLEYRFLDYVAPEPPRDAIKVQATVEFYIKWLYHKYCWGIWCKKDSRIIYWEFKDEAMEKWKDEMGIIIIDDRNDIELTVIEEGEQNVE